MTFKKIIFLIIFICSVLDDWGCGGYDNLEISPNAPSIRKKDLPSDFTDNAFETVNVFIKKTFNLDYECLIYFDYMSGEILRFETGKFDEVKLDFDDCEFDGYHVASLHNHPSNVFSPPSGKNFGILTREFEDYELIVSRDGLWILKAKGTYEELVVEFNLASDTFFNSSFLYCANRYHDEKIIDKMTSINYGNRLLKYINDKNINDIQLTKKRYVNMKTELNNHVAEYACRTKMITPETIRLAREMERDPTILSAKDRIYYFYKLVGMDIEYDEIFSEFD